MRLGSGAAWFQHPTLAIVTDGLGEVVVEEGYVSERALKIMRVGAATRSISTL